MKQDILDKIASLVAEDPARYQRRSNDETAMDRFQTLFPLESLPQMTLEKYCLGKGSQPENFSWWLERGLERAIGRYSPGNAEGHVMYQQQGGGYYMHRFLADLDPQGALDVVRKTLHAIASCATLQEAKVVEDDHVLAKRAGVELKRIVGGRARRLRILSMYHPEWMIPINSSDHLRHFLTSLSENGTPETSVSSLDLIIKLSARLEEVRKAIGVEVTPGGFSALLYDDRLGINPPKREGISKGDDSGSDKGNEGNEVKMPLNLILYGPPGTGKTYTTIDRALKIVDPDFYRTTQDEDDGRKQRKARFDELMRAKRIGFVTFHQSFSYEDFVEGLKASTDEAGQVRYEVEDGVFKQMCSAAAAVQGATRAPASSPSVDPADRTIWKMSLGNSKGADAVIYDECIQKGRILLGWGEGVDFTGVGTREEIKSRLKIKSRNRVAQQEEEESDYAITACHAFVNRMKPGDLIIVSDGNHKFRAIGEVTGDYRFLTVDEDQDFLYQQCRDVKWLTTFSPSLPVDQLMSVVFSQQSIYQLKPPSLDLKLLRNLLKDTGTAPDESPRPFVLIIDEINRANISRVFGELITLIEDGKRAGQDEAISVKLPYSKEPFSVPSNLYLIGTMNTADRSLAQVDIALRRRFVFEELMPDSSLLAMDPIDGIHVDRMLETINRRIEVLYDREHMIGHSFFLSLFSDPSLAELGRIFTGSILPLLEEYFFEDWEKICLVLGDHRKPHAYAMIAPKYSAAEIEGLFGSDSDHPIRTAFERNLDALGSPESYIGIYDTSVFSTDPTK